MKLTYLRYVVENLRHRQLRSWLTVLGIIVGFAAVVGIFSVGQGLQSSIEEQFAELGGDKIIVQEKGFGGSPTVTVKGFFSEQDLDAVKGTRGIAEAAGYFLQGATIEVDDERQVSFAIGIPTNNDEDFELVVETFTLKVGEGRQLQEGDADAVALGSRFGNELDIFQKRVRVRDSIDINGQKFTVVGIYQSIGNPVDDSHVYLSLDAMERLYGVKDEFTAIMARVTPGSVPRQVADDVEDELRDLRNVEKGKEDFFAETFEQLIETFTTVLNVVKIVLVLIAVISLAVGVVNIMNTMYTAVLERTQEIGLMKSIGARNEDIRDIFLLESGIIGIIGGVLGVFSGWLLAQGLSAIAAAAGFTILKPFFPWWLGVGAVLISFVVGMLSGVLPAIQASQLSPVEALRYE